MKCLNCRGEIAGRSSKKYCSVSCKQASYRNAVTRTVTKSVTVTPETVTEPVTVTPGISPEIQKKLSTALLQLYKDKDKILSHSTSGEAVFYLGDMRILIK